jgi:hypothetical protein
MPVNVQWAHPADLAGEYLQGVQTASQIKEAQQRLQQQAEERAQRRIVQQQRLEVENAYRKQETDLAAQRLQDLKDANDRRTTAAAAQLTAMKTWQNGLDAIDKSDLTPEQKEAAKTTFIMRNAPSMKFPAEETSAMLKAVRSSRPNIPASAIPTIAGSVIAPVEQNVTPAVSSWIPFRSAPPQTNTVYGPPMRNVKANNPILNVPGAALVTGTGSDAQTNTIPPEAQKVLGTNSPFYAAPASSPSSDTTASAQPSPLPTKKSDLVDGKTYQTKKGVATWDEKQDKFVAVTQ